MHLFRIYICLLIQILPMATDVFYFNPTCELAVANGSFSYMPPRLLRDFESDCSVLPFVFGTSGDFVLTEKKPSKEFIMRMTDVGFEMPEFCQLQELISGKAETIGSILPWGWSPAAHFFLKDLKEKCSPGFHESPVFSWKEEHKALFERITSLRFLTDFLKQNPLDFLIEKDRIGRKVTSIEGIEELLEKNVPLVLKAPLSSSGRGIQILRKQTLNTSNRQWISGIFNQQKYLIAEPFLTKVMDFSFQFKISNDETEYLGYSVFETNSNGQYQSTLIHPEMTRKIDTDLKIKIETTALLLKEALKDSVYTKLHRGFLGIDSMICNEIHGLKIQPCIEINSRMNMGILTMQIERRIHSEASGRIVLFYGSLGEFQKFAIKKKLEQPIIIRNGKLISGFLSLVEPDAEKQFGAYVVLAGAR